MSRVLVRPGVSLAVLAALLESTAARADLGNGYYGHHMWGGDGWLGWIAGPIMMLLILGAAVAVVMLVARWLGGSGRGAAPPTDPSAGPGQSALQILEERFARGEIDEVEFEKRRRVLRER